MISRSFKTSIKRRLFGSILFTTIFAVLVCSFLFTLNTKERQNLEHTEFLHTYVAIISQELTHQQAFGNQNKLDQLLEQFYNLTNAEQVAYFSKDGSLLSYYPRTNWITNKIPSFTQEKKTVEGFGLSHNFFPVLKNNTTMGVLYRGETKVDIRAQLQRNLHLLILSLAIATVIALVIYIQLNRNITRPINDITQATKDFSSEKNYTLRLPIERQDEFGDLIHSFNEMLTQVQLRDRVMTEQVELKAKEIELDRNFARTILDNIHSSLLIFDKNTGLITSSNRKFYNNFKLDPDNKTLGDILKQLDINRHTINAIKDGHYSHDDAISCRDLNGSPQFVEIHLIDLPGDENQLLVINNVTLRTLTEEALYKEKKRAQVTLDSIADGVITTDMDGKITYMNPVAENYTGQILVDTKGLPITQVLKVFDIKTHIQFENPINEFIGKSSNNWKPDGMLVNSERQEFFVENSIAPMRNEKNELIGTVVVFRDVTKLQRLIQKISYQASHDSLTGLVNRAEFEKRLKSTLNNAKQKKGIHCLLYLDLDKFKAVNDTCGHTAGDQMLCQIAAIIHQKIRQRDTFARLGGDEFGIILEHCDQEQALKIAGDIQKDLNEYQFNWKEHFFRTSVSIGAVELTESSGEYIGALSLADSACYAAKEAGRNRVYLYQQDDADFAKKYGDVFWVTKITRAMEDNRFYLCSQKIQPISIEEQGDHYEILIRMLDEDGNTVSPSVFLGAAERYNLNPMIDRWVVDRTLDILDSNPQKVKELSLCSINLSGPTFTDDKFLDYLFDRLQRSPVPKEKICFEVTETAAVYSFDKARQFMSKIRNLGCKFALDDFGTGMSSFAYLKNLPADYLKIDGVFVRNISNSEVDAAMVKSINEIGHVMGMQTIAEFSENDMVTDKLKVIGVDYAQGFGIEKPIIFAEPLASKKAAS